MYHGDPTLKRASWRPRVHALAEYLDVSSVRVVVAADDLSDRRLAGAVFADQRVNLSLAKIEIDAIEDDRRTETLDDALESHGRPLRGEAHAERISALGRFGHQLVRLS